MNFFINELLTAVSSEGFQLCNKCVKNEKMKKCVRISSAGPGLVFQVYPIAVGSLPAAPLWSVLFFVLIFMLGIDSSVSIIEKK